jgi:hypothetical protein
MKTNAENSAECEWVAAELGQRPPSPDSAQRLEIHLTHCEACRLARDWDRQLADILQDSRFVPTRDGIEPRLQTLIARRNTRRLSGVSAAIAAAATLFLCGTIAWWTGDSRTSTEDRPESAASMTEPGEPLPLDALTILASEPPVPTLNRPQISWLAVLTDATEGELP